MVLTETYSVMLITPENSPLYTTKEKSIFSTPLSPLTQLLELFANVVFNSHKDCLHLNAVVM